MSLHFTTPMLTATANSMVRFTPSNGYRIYSNKRPSAYFIHAFLDPALFRGEFHKMPFHRLRSKLSRASVELEPAFKKPPGILKMKMKDLQDLMKQGAIPGNYHRFLMDLLCRMLLKMHSLMLRKVVKSYCIL